MNSADKATDQKSLPVISIVTPSYNQGRFIEETITSILNQQYPRLQYIVMDGGSTDNSVEIIKKYAHRLDYWESKNDRGQSHAINKGLDAARATFSTGSIPTICCCRARFGRWQRLGGVSQGRSSRGTPKFLRRAARWR